MITTLEKVQIKDIWKTEDKDFTPWLLENIKLLNEELGLNIQDANAVKEKKLENFYVDIVAEDGEGKVIIENQFNKSDHDHLGKLLTYLSNVEDTRKALWIVEEAKQEHLNAIEWLNTNVNTCSFYLVKVQVFKIEDSSPAVKFDLISGPTEKTKAVGKIKSEDSERDKIRLKFWGQFLERANMKTKLFSNISPGKYNWLGTSSGIIRGIGYNVAVRTNSAQSEIYIDLSNKDEAQKVNKEIFQELYENKDTIENDFGDKLLWEKLDSARASRISKVTNVGGWKNEEKWEDVHNQMINHSIKLEKIFSSYFQKLSNKYK